MLISRLYKLNNLKIWTLTDQLKAWPEPTLTAGVGANPNHGKPQYINPTQPAGHRPTFNSAPNIQHVQQDRNQDQVPYRRTITNRLPCLPRTKLILFCQNQDEFEIFDLRMTIWLQARFSTIYLRTKSVDYIFPFICMLMSKAIEITR